MTWLFANNVTTTVTAGGTGAPAQGTVETWTVSSAAGFPVPGTDQQFTVVDLAAATEIILVIAVSGGGNTTWTVIRGAESTTPVAHTAGFTIQAVVTAAPLNTFVQGPLFYSATAAGIKANTIADQSAAINTWLLSLPEGATAFFPATGASNAQTRYYLANAVEVPRTVRILGPGWSIGQILFTAMSSYADAQIMRNWQYSDFATFTATNASPAVFTVSGGSFAAGQPVTLAGGSLPAGFSALTTYYVTSISGSTFQLAGYPGGSGIASSSTGSGTVVTFNAPNTTSWGTSGIGSNFVHLENLGFDVNGNSGVTCLGLAHIAERSFVQNLTFTNTQGSAGTGNYGMALFANGDNPGTVSGRFIINSFTGYGLGWRQWLVADGTNGYTQTATVANRINDLEITSYTSPANSTVAGTGGNQGSQATTVASGSNGGTISSIASWGAGFGGNGVLDVASTAGFTAAGTLIVAASGGTTAIITYTGTTGTTFTGCAYVSGSTGGTVATGAAVSNGGTCCTDSTIFLRYINRLRIRGHQETPPPNGTPDTAGIRIINCSDIKIEDYYYLSGTASYRPFVKVTPDPNSTSQYPGFNGTQVGPVLDNVEFVGGGGWAERTDASCGITSGSNTVTDTSIVATDLYRPAYGPGIPSGAYISSVTPGTSFTMVTTVNGSTSNANALFTATVSLAIGANVLEDEAAAGSVSNPGTGIIRHFRYNAPAFAPHNIISYTGNEITWMQFQTAGSAERRHAKSLCSADPYYIQLAPSNAIAESFPRATGAATSGTAILTSQQLYLVAVYMYPGDKVSSLSFWSGSTAANTPSNWWFAFFDQSRNLVAISADQTTAAWGASTEKTLAMSAAWSASLPAVHYAGVLVNATGTPSIEAVTQENIGSAAPVINGNSTSGLTTPGSFTSSPTASAPSYIAGRPYVLVT